MSVTLSIDAMGGDQAPYIIIKGIHKALNIRPDIHFLIFGDQGKIQPFLEKYPEVQNASTLFHTNDIITNDMKAATALRKGQNSSMRLAIEAVKNQQAQGIISAGNTGALMATAKLVMKTLSGIDRPAIAAPMASYKKSVVMLDLGANVQCNTNHLLQFAIMGRIFAETMLNRKNPSVGILNIGEEFLKGNDTLRTVASILREDDFPINYHGFIEGNDIGKGTVDVIVTDGFTGNVALKTIEGTAQLISKTLKDTFQSSFCAKLGALIARKPLKNLKHTLDPRYYNGALFLGLNAICVKSHGGTDATGFTNAILFATNLIESDLNTMIRNNMETVSAKIKLIEK